MFVYRLIKITDGLGWAGSYLLHTEVSTGCKRSRTVPAEVQYDGQYRQGAKPGGLVYTLGFTGVLIVKQSDLERTSIKIMRDVNVCCFRRCFYCVKSPMNDVIPSVYQICNKLSWEL